MVNCGYNSLVLFFDSLTSVTNCFIEYSFLVKKVVFNINILPIVKVISSSYVHIFFIILMIFIYMFNGFMPDIYYIQILYYLLCSFLLILSIAYLTSSIVIFFKDLNQIVLISLQVLNWLTPIMWNYEMVSEKYRWVLQLNPLYYIISGYRDTFINKVWFYQHPINTLYFLCFCGISF